MNFECIFVIVNYLFFQKNIDCPTRIGTTVLGLELLLANMIFSLDFHVRTSCAFQSFIKNCSVFEITNSTIYVSTHPQLDIMYS